MDTATWRLQDAKNQFSKVVEAALQGEPQHVTRRGREVAVVLAVEEYERLAQINKTSALGFVEHLLMLPKDNGEFERLPFELREVNFW